MITIHVLSCGELFAEVLNAIAAFMKQDSFLGLLQITALAGIVMATVEYLRTRDSFESQIQCGLFIEQHEYMGIDKRQSLTA